MPDENVHVIPYTEGPLELGCPSCRGAYVHHGKVTVGSRSGEDTPGIVAEVEGAVCNVRYEDLFAGRRSDFSAEFWCELCHEKFRIGFKQHKGVTLLTVTAVGKVTDGEKLPL